MYHDKVFGDNIFKHNDDANAWYDKIFISNSSFQKEACVERD